MAPVTSAVVTLGAGEPELATLLISYTLTEAGSMGHPWLPRQAAAHAPML